MRRWTAPLAVLAAIAALACASPAPAQSIRPAPLTLVRPAPPAADACAEAARPAFLAGFERQLAALMSYGEAVGAYGERLADWKSRRLIELGAWTDADHGAFALALLEDERFMRFQEASMAEAEDLTEAAFAYGRAIDAEEPAAACAHARTALRAADRIVDSAAAQWAYMHARYDAEAAARGVNLE
ncbi:MAG: hypothetical protein GC206_00930 [Alphaproteobacteria bacterium]|nr:hypothetical protein [Alphaproteobacteria bacterium]